MNVRKRNSQGKLNLMSFTFNNINIFGLFVEDTIIKRSTVEKTEKGNSFRTISIGGPPLYMGFVMNLIAKFYPKIGYAKIYSYIDEDLATVLRIGDYFPQETVELLPSDTSPRFELIYLQEEERNIILKNIPDLFDINEFGLNINKESVVIVSSVFQEFNDETLFEELRKNDSFIVLDPQGFFRKILRDSQIRYDQWFDEEILTRVDCVKLSRNEACSLGLGDDSVKIIEELLKIGPQYVIITDGRFGAFLGKRKIGEPKPEIFKIPAYVTGRSIDETGAGDAFLYTFISFLTSLTDANVSIAYASSISSILIENRFNLDKYSLEEIEKRKDEVFFNIQQLK